MHWKCTNNYELKTNVSHDIMYSQTAVICGIFAFILFSMLIHASYLFTTLKYRGVSHVWHHQHETNECHWWCHDGNSDRRPLSLPLQYNQITRCFWPYSWDSWDFKAAETFYNVTNIVWAWDKFLSPLLASAETGIYPHLASQYHTWPSAAHGIVMLRVDKLLCSQKQTRGN